MAFSTIFTVQMMSFIQAETPQHLIGKVIAVILTVSMCAQPLGNALYRFGGSYAPPMMGKVVDMFYFPLFRWEGVPRLLSFLVDGRGYFFGAIFNLADAYISVAVVYLILFQRRFFNSADSVF